MGILAETAAFLSVSLFIYAIARLYAGEFYNKYIYLLGFALILLFGTRPTFAPFIFMFILYFLFLKIPSRSKILLTSFVVFFTALIFLMQEKLSNKNQDMKSYIFANQILWSRYELRDEPLNWMPQHGEKKQASKDYLNNLKKRIELDSICTANKYDRRKYFINWAVNDIINNPFLTLRQYSLKFFQAQSFIITPLMKSNKSNIIKYGVHGYINLINYVLIITAIFSMILLLKNKDYRLFIPFLFFWGWSIIYVFVFHSEQRYMFPSRPILLVLFAYWISSKRDGFLIK